jgi:alpha-D-xyloside xylohydrolase
MKFVFRLIVFVCPVFCFGQSVKSIERLVDRVNIHLQDGTLSIQPLTENAVSVKFYRKVSDSLEELVLIARSDEIKYQLTETASDIKIKTKDIIVTVDRKNGHLTYSDKQGRVFLTEKAGTRKLIPGTVSGEPCYSAEQSFESPDGEYIYGLGQFQDGHFNLKGVTRRLTQVNTQISIPYIYSSKGYGLLWHQYGLTDYNPADNFVSLTKQASSSDSSNMIEVTTDAGTQRVQQSQAAYKGTFSVTEPGEYAVMLDLGGMGNRHFVVVDGKPCIDQTNLWLPPTVSAKVFLTAGTHSIQVLCKSDNEPTISWKKIDNITTFRSPNAKLLDYVVFYGTRAESVISTYRKLSGQVPMLPLWAYGFWQCRERYNSGDHLVQTVKEFRKRRLPMDVIVQDWQYWGKYGWGVPKFDETSYPEPAKFIRELHDLNAHFNISVWENIDKASPIGKEYVAGDLYIPGSGWIDMLNPRARSKHWNTMNQNLFSQGVDSWWLDAAEPENDALKGKKTYFGLGDFYRLTYPLFVSKAVYEGQRGTTADKRVCILTRSAFPGQQRYGIINWSGDIGSDWDTYKRQIVAGLNYTITGFPYWTTDIGGFFRPETTQYTDTNYHDLLTRWFQWGALNPVFRIHGYKTETEPWKFGEAVESNMRKAMNLRYRLLPYIYSEAWQVSKKGSTMMRPLVMDFNDDTVALNQPFEFMFGKSLLVAPITAPNVWKWNIYLPKSNGWFDFWTGKRYQGGQTVKATVLKDKSPLFVKAGSIIPLGKLVQYSGQLPADTMEIRIYKGAEGKFELYEDEGDNYNYEKGNYSVILFTWNDKSKTLTISKRQGSYPGFINNRVFQIVLVSESNGTGIESSKIKKQISYIGNKVIIRLK